MIGQTVGNYRITRLLGQGGMGAVYLAEHPGIGRKAAVKILHAQLAGDRDVVTRFFNEARAANAIRHPGIVEMFDSGTLPSGTSYIVMEFLDGESLAARLRRGRMPLGEALEIGRQAAAALGAAHAKGIIHRDLKPDNLFLIPDPNEPGRERVKVLDFGIAKLSPGLGGSGSVRTRTGAVLGTPLYMSPEQCRGTREIDRRTDVYALGVILYEMVCGRPPFYSEGFGELAHLHISAPPPPPHTWVAGLPREVEQALLRALAKEPADRFPSMSELHRALGGAPISGLGDVVTDETLPAPRRTEVLPQTTLASSAGVAASLLEPPPPRRRMGAVILGTAALAAGGVLVWNLDPFHVATQRLELPPPPPPPPAEQPAEQPHPTPQPPTTIDVHIESAPAAARVVRERDGAVLGQTPFREAWPVGTGVERLRLELDGHRPESVVVPLAQGLETRVPLVKEPEPAPHKPKVHPPPKATTPKPAKPREPVPI
jgi:serine/threonine-protein kinase